MIDGDDKLSKRYREIGSEEPDGRLDASILAASRRAVAPRRGSQRWAIPVSLAAVLVLAVGVTLRMQQEMPGIETSTPTREAPEPPASPPLQTAPPMAIPESAKPQLQSRSKDKLEESRQDEARQATTTKEKKALETQHAPAPQSSPALEQKQAEPERPVEPPLAKVQPKPFADAVSPAPPAPASNLAPSSPAAASSAPAPSSRPAPETLRLEAQSGASPTTPARPQADAAAPPPAQAPMAAARAKHDSRDLSADTAKKEANKDPLERELERIAVLRREGRHVEADVALDKFRRENPAYKIPDALWEQVI